MTQELAKAFEITLDLAYKAGGLQASDAIDMVKQHARDLFKQAQEVVDGEESE